jgi:hypothetical protein
MGLAIFQDLTQHGYDVFIDYDGIASGNFGAAILENIKARAHFLVLLTPTALEPRSDPVDWMRREIEAALDSQRNIVPLMLAGFKFGTSASQLTGKLAALKEYNGLEIPAGFFSEAMGRLRNKFLNVPVDAVLHPASGSAQQVAKELKDKATMAAEAQHRAEEEPRKQEATAAQHLAGEEGRRQEAEDRRRLDEAEAEKRRQDEDGRRRQEIQQAEARLQDEKRRRLEPEAKLDAKEAQRRTQPEQGPQQQIERWLLPLIGAGAAALPIVALVPIAFAPWVLQHWPSAHIVDRDALVLSITFALWGGASGMLVPRLGIPKAVAIPAIPAFVIAAGVDVAADGLRGGGIVVPAATLAPSYFLTWLAFWLHSLWARKHPMISGLAKVVPSTKQPDRQPDKQPGSQWKATISSRRWSYVCIEFWQLGQPPHLLGRRKSTEHHMLEIDLESWFNKVLLDGVRIARFRKMTNFQVGSLPNQFQLRARKTFFDKVKNIQLFIDNRLILSAE